MKNQQTLDLLRSMGKQHDIWMARAIVIAMLSDHEDLLTMDKDQAYAMYEEMLEKKKHMAKTSKRENVKALLDTWMIRAMCLACISGRYDVLSLSWIEASQLHKAIKIKQEPWGGMTVLQNVAKQLEFIIAHGDENSANAARAALYIIGENGNEVGS